jgi:hypothetical protein
LEKEAADKLNELKDNFDKFMKILLKGDVTKTAA